MTARGARPPRAAGTTPGAPDGVWAPPRGTALKRPHPLLWVRPRSLPCHTARSGMPYGPFRSPKRAVRECRRGRPGLARLQGCGEQRPGRRHRWLRSAPAAGCISVAPQPGWRAGGPQPCRQLACGAASAGPLPPDAMAPVMCASGRGGSAFSVTGQCFQCGKSIFSVRQDNFLSAISQFSQCAKAMSSVRQGDVLSAPRRCFQCDKTIYSLS